MISLQLRQKQRFLAKRCVDDGDIRHLVKFMDLARSVSNRRINKDLLPFAWIYIFRARQSLRSIPKMELPLSDKGAGEAIKEFLDQPALFWRRKDAACLLRLPNSPDEYLRGKSRQALRTNLRKADLKSFSVKIEPASECDALILKAISDGVKIKYLDLLLNNKTPAEAKNFVARNGLGETIGFARVMMDKQVAWIMTLVSIEDDDYSIVRWKLTYHVIADCIMNGIRIVLCDSLFQLNFGSHYFQERLGFSPFRIVKPEQDCR